VVRHRPLNPTTVPETCPACLDLLGDFVTLVCWNLSRKPPSQRYPYGFAKFETLGTTTVSLLLIGGALGIGYHSYHLLIEALAQAASSMPTSPLHDVLDRTIAILQSVPAIGHRHVDAHAPITELDPNAAWFAAVSVVAKEWLYRATKTVADEERSPVLHANAVHHRSDAYSSLVALFAIIGSVMFPAIPLDPIGGECLLHNRILPHKTKKVYLSPDFVGLLVSLVILRQGLGLFGGAFRDITDASVPATTRHSLIRALDPLLEPSSSLAGASALLGIRDLRARRAGSLFFVDLSADVSASLSFQRATELEEEITRTLKAARREVAEVRIRFHPVHREES
jgi:divalent metal cation (Fe/Co/Zn/Cd) transporter